MCQAVNLQKSYHVPSGFVTPKASRNTGLAGVLAPVPTHPRIVLIILGILTPSAIKQCTHKTCYTHAYMCYHKLYNISSITMYTCKQVFFT